MLFNSIVGFTKLIKLCGCWCSHTSTFILDLLVFHIIFLDTLIKGHSITYFTLSFFKKKTVIYLCSSYLFLILCLYFNKNKINNIFPLKKISIFHTQVIKLPYVLYDTRHNFKYAMRRKEDVFEKILYDLVVFFLPIEKLYL